MKTYSEKLRDPRWQRKRLEIMQRDNFTCKRCGSTDKPLCVHHWRYTGEPWEIGNRDLDTLCDDCHQSFEDSITHLNARFGGSLLDFLKSTLRWDAMGGESSLVCRLDESDGLLFAGKKGTAIEILESVVCELQARIEKLKTKEESFR